MNGILCPLDYATHWKIPKIHEQNSWRIYWKISLVYKEDKIKFLKDKESRLEELCLTLRY